MALEGEMVDAASTAAERRMNMTIKHDNCKNCRSICIHAGKDRDFVCINGVSCKITMEKPQTNAQKIRSMSDEELAEFLTHINPTNCQDCAFSHGWRCQPDRDDYSDFEKCKEGRKRWLKQPAKGE